MSESIGVEGQVARAQEVERLRAENETLRRERDEARAAVNDCTLIAREFDRRNEESKRARLAAEAQAHALREAMQVLVSSVSAHLARGEDTTPGDFERAWKCAHAALALKSGDALRALVEQVATMQRERDARLVDHEVRGENGDNGNTNTRFGNSVRSVRLITLDDLGRAGK